jgi:Flp pilus assembly protein TadG
MRERKTFRSFLPEKSGAAAVEFAIVSSAFFAFVIGIAYVGIMLFNNASLNYAVEDAARTVAMNNSATLDQIKTKVNSYMTTAGLPSATVLYSKSTINSVLTGHITANYTQTYKLPFVNTFHITFNADAYVPLNSVIQS